MMRVIFCFILLLPVNLFAQEFAVIKGGSTLFQDDGATAQVFESNVSITVSVLEKRRDVVRVATIEHPGCHANFEPTFSVEFWVRKSDLHWVVTQSFHQTYSDGTDIILSPGLAIRPGENSRTWIVEHTVNAKIVDPTFGKFFTTLDKQPPVGVNSEAKGVTVGGTKTPDRHHRIETKDGDDYVVGPCLRAKVQLKEKSSVLFGTGRGIPQASTFSIRKDAIIHWPDRVRAGELRDRYELDDISTLNDDGMRCFRAVDDTGTYKSDFCVEGKDVTTQGNQQIPRITRGEVTVGPSLPKEVIRRVIRTRVKEIQKCYSALLKGPMVEGKVLAKFVIGASGHVIQSNIVENNTGSLELGDCVLKEVEQLKFPEPLGGGTVIVNYPFVFKIED